MKKRDFIQQATIEFLPQVNWDLDKAVSYAERLWEKLQKLGYGDSTPSEPKQTGVNYYLKLSKNMQVQFDKFWVAFNKGQQKQGKQGAAMRWWQMGEIDRVQCESIIAAAEQTAIHRQNLPPGQTPIMAQGWLSELRFLDNEVTQQEQTEKKHQQHGQKMVELIGDLNNAKRMLDKTDEDLWRKEVKRLTDKLQQLRQRDSHE